MANHNLALPFWRNSLRHPKRPALVAERTWNYLQLSNQVRSVAGWLGDAQRVAILASRSSAACISVLACAWSGATFVPLGLDWPESRLAQIFNSCEVDVLLLDQHGETRLSAELKQALPTRIARADQIEHAPSPAPAPVGDHALAYIIHTSGSSGIPKAVTIRARSVRKLVTRMVCELEIGRFWRTAGNFELSFDGSIIDMFPCWEGTGTLFPIPREQAMAPQAFLAEHEIEACILTPAHLQMMLALKAGRLPSLRWCAFGADALPAPAVENWRVIASRARLFNLYGPTEGTVAWLWHPLRGNFDRSLVPLGRPFSGLKAVVVDPNHRQVPIGQPGELLLVGDQVSPGYWNSPSLTASCFSTWDNQPAYFTGDYVEQDEQGLFHFLGRTDRQVKIRGWRIDLVEVERELQRADPTSRAAALSWPGQPGQLNRLVAFVAGSLLTKDQFQECLRRTLPEGSRPSQIYLLDSMPTENGKVNYESLRCWLRALG